MRALQRRQQARDDLLGRLAAARTARRSAWLRSTATCLKAWIRSAARWRLATSCLAASWLPAMNSSSRERRIGAVADLGAKIVAAAREARRHRQADADRIVDLVRDAGDQAAERGELLGLDQASAASPAARAARFSACSFEAAQLVLGLALGDGVLAEHLDRARHLADLVARLGAARRSAVVLRPRSRASRSSAPAAAALMLRAIARPISTTIDQEDDRDDRDLRDRCRPACWSKPLLRLRSRCAHLADRLSMAVDHRGLIAVDRLAQQLRRGSAKCSARLSMPVAEHDGALRQRAERAALQIVVGEVEHDRNGAARSSRGSAASSAASRASVR